MIQQYFLANIWNGTQFFTADGKPLVGGKIATYSAGSMSLQQATYTDNTGNTPNLNPIVLDSAGRIPQEMWCSVNYDYQFVLYAPDGETVIMACDNIGTHDPFPDQINNDGKYLRTSGDGVFWDNPLPDTLGQDGKVLKVSVGGMATEWGSEIPDQTGNIGKFLETNGVTTSWGTPSGGGGASYPEYIGLLVNNAGHVSDGGYYTDWTVTDQQVSTECSATTSGLGPPLVFTVTTPGSYKVTVTNQIRSSTYPEGTLITDAMFYGTQCTGSLTGFDLTTHTSGTATAWEWNQGFQHQLQWTDTFYVMMYNPTPVTFGIGVYANTVAGSWTYTAQCLVSVVRTDGTPIQPA